jgi:hypothetical protein
MRPLRTGAEPSPPRGDTNFACQSAGSSSGVSNGAGSLHPDHAPALRTRTRTAPRDRDGSGGNGQPTRTWSGPSTVSVTGAAPASASSSSAASCGSAPSVRCQDSRGVASGTTTGCAVGAR